MNKHLVPCGWDKKAFNSDSPEYGSEALSSVLGAGHENFSTVSCTMSGCGHHEAWFPADTSSVILHLPTI